MSVEFPQPDNLQHGASDSSPAYPWERLLDEEARRRPRLLCGLVGALGRGGMAFPANQTAVCVVMIGRSGFGALDRL